MILGAPQAAAALLNEEQTSLTVVAEYRTEDRPTSLGRVIPVAGNLATQHVLKHRAPLPISDALTDPRNAAMHQHRNYCSAMEGRGTVSMLILPLLARDEIIGTIGLNHTERHEFTDDEVRLAFNMAMSTAQSLATARMFDQIQVTLAELQRVEEARRQHRDELDRYLPDAIREKIEESYYAKVNQQAELDQVVRSKQFIEDPLNHVALYSDHGVVHVRDVARNVLSILDIINGELIPHRNHLWLEFMKGYGVMLAYNHDIGMMDFSAFGRAMHPEFAAQAVFTPAYDSIVDTFWDENWGNVSWRLIKLAEHGAVTGDLKRVLRELLSMSIGHSKSKVSINTLNDRAALRATMLESIATDIGHLFHLQQIRKAEKKLAKNQAKVAELLFRNGPGNPDLVAALENDRLAYQEFMGQGVPRRNQTVDRFYTNFEEEAYTWLASDHPSLQALTRDVIDTLRSLRVADALRQRGTTLKTSGGYQRHDVQPWIPLGNTSVIRGDVQEARVTAEKNIRLLMIPKEIYLKYWHDTYNLTEFAPVIDRLFAQDEQRRNEQALHVVKQFVMIDGRLEDHQVAFVQRFIESIGESANLEKIRAELVEFEPTNFAALRQNAVNYLASNPPYMQVARLRDLINLLTETGETASEGKRLVLGELNGLLAEYLDQDKISVSFQVVVVPQSAEQEVAIRTLLPAASRIETGFGYAYLCGTIIRTIMLR